MDEFFRQQLHDHSYEPPMHLWEGIEAQRSTTAPTDIPHFRLYKVLNIFSIAALVTIGTALWITRSVAPQTPATLHDIFPEQPIMAEVSPLTQTEVTPGALLRKSEPLSERRATLTVTPALPTATFSVKQVQNDIRQDVPGIISPATKVTERLPSRAAPLEQPPRTEDVTCAKFEERRIWRSTVDFVVSPDLVSRELKAVSPQYEEYAAARNTTENFRYGFSAGVRFSTTAPSGLAVRSGLNYSQINEQFSYRNDQEERVTITTEYGSNGQVIGTDTVVDYFSVRRTVNNRYVTIDIPLILGYEFTAGNNFGVAINGGTFINMLFTQEGEFLSPATFEPVEFSGDTPDTYHAYRNRLGLAFYGSIGLTCRLSEDLDLLIEPHIKWRPQSITTPGYVLQQRFFTSGLFLGLRKRV